jgi:hypothetical protein
LLIAVQEEDADKKMLLNTTVSGSTVGYYTAKKHQSANPAISKPNEESSVTATKTPQFIGIAPNEIPYLETSLYN